MSHSWSKFFFTLALLVALGGWAQNAPLPEYKAKANIVSLLPDYVHWAQDPRTNNKSTPFQIGVLGTSPFGSFLEESFATRHSTGNPVKIRYSKRVQELLDCQLIFICNAYPNEISGILSQTQGRPILTVGDMSGCAHRGVMVNLVAEQHRIQMEINLKALKASGLSASAHMLKLSLVVER